MTDEAVDAMLDQPVTRHYATQLTLDRVDAETDAAMHARFAVEDAKDE